MLRKIRAIYRNGCFVPQTPCHLREGSEVEITVQGPIVIPAEITDPEEKKRHMKEVVARMQQNPIPLNAPRFTREELHERR